MVNEIEELYNKAQESIKNLEKACSKIKVKNDEGFPLVSKAFKIELWKIKKNLESHFIFDLEYNTISLWSEIDYYKIEKSERNGNN